MITHVFSYGTLLPEVAPQEVRAFVERFRYRGDGCVAGHLYDLGEYPGAVLDANARSLVRGRLFEIPPGSELLDALDRYEGDDFTRKALGVKLTGDGSVPAWVYEYNGSSANATVIEHGDYLQWLREHPHRASTC